MKLFQKRVVRTWLDIYAFILNFCTINLFFNFQLAWTILTNNCVHNISIAKVNSINQHMSTNTVNVKQLFCTKNKEKSLEKKTNLDKILKFNHVIYISSIYNNFFDN
jgi:hypothetical protein